MGSIKADHRLHIHVGVVLVKERLMMETDGPERDHIVPSSSVKSQDSLQCTRSI